MSFESNSGLGTRKHYGIRTAKEGVEGYVPVEGMKKQIVLDVTAESITDDNFRFDLAQIPSGALIVGAYASVSEVFVMGGTTPTILIGTDGSEVTNGIVVSEAIGEALGTADVTATATGTWNAALAADAEISVVLGGTSPTITTVGKMKVTLEYV